jgi:2-polyprenyl-3-methyl-5-hydroxy-6-metoxy-1,4-benzoquinol methylase
MLAKLFTKSFVDLNQRSEQDELLDAPDIKQADLFQNLAELDTINRYLGGHSLTLKGLEKLMGLPGQGSRQREWSILDIGCGGGDSLNAIYHWAQSQGLRLTLTGVDLKADCIRYASEHAVSKDIQWLVSDYRRFFAIT